MDVALAKSFFHKWKKSGGASPAHSQCVGFRQPLFLGGADDLDNLELSDIDVYWHLMSQIIEQVRDLPAGTPIAIER